MPPDAAWPALPSYRTFTPADHAAHTSPKGMPYPETLMPGSDSRKAAKQIMKFAHKPHLKFTAKAQRRRVATRKKKENK
jgi:hypothetical protein